MTDRGGSDGAATRGTTPRVVLAHEPAIALGPLTIEPALRQLVHADGRDEVIEPRVMEVLVVLLRAGTRIVTRDELCEAAWDGRIVGDDAINRVLARLRRLSEGIAAGVFRVETITRVGYRLIATAPIAPVAADPARPAGVALAGDPTVGPAAPRSPDGTDAPPVPVDAVSPAARRGPGRRTVIGGGAVAVAAAAIGGWWWRRSDSATGDSVIDMKHYAVFTPLRSDRPFATLLYSIGQWSLRSRRAGPAHHLQINRHLHGATSVHCLVGRLPTR